LTSSSAEGIGRSGVLLKIFCLLAVGVHARRQEVVDVVYDVAPGGVALAAVGGLMGDGIRAAGVAT
jgi:hypothetical protein